MTMPDPALRVSLLARIEQVSAELRHAYQQLVLPAPGIVSTPSLRRSFANGLLAPQIRRLEQLAALLRAEAPPPALTGLDVAVADAVACFTKWDATPDMALDSDTISALHDLVAEWKRHRQSLSSTPAAPPEPQP